VKGYIFITEMRCVPICLEWQNAKNSLKENQSPVLDTSLRWVNSKVSL